MNRRDVMKLMATVGIGGLAGCATTGHGAGSMKTADAGMKTGGQKREGDGTPLQFIPKGAPDPDPLKDELAKYPDCPYCGMSRVQLNFSRHMVHYDDDLADAVCSIHCLAISLSINVDRGPKAIYAANHGATGEVKPMINVNEASYLIGSKLKPVMTLKSKAAFATAEAAHAAQKDHGGKVGSFDDALTETYLDMAQDTIMIRKRRAERRQKMAPKSAPQP